MKEIYFLRHAQSKGNVENRILGQTDLPLSNLGLEQANAIVSGLLQYTFDRIDSSDLTRTLQTIEPYLMETDRKVIQSKQLEEMYFGNYEGVTKEEMKAQIPDTYDIFTTDFGHFTPPEGESTFECGKRIYDYVMDVINSTDYNSYLFVSHAGAIRSFDCYIFNTYDKDQIKSFPLNATLSLYEYEDRKFKNIFYSKSLI